MEAYKTNLTSLSLQTTTKANPLKNTQHAPQSQNQKQQSRARNHHMRPPPSTQSQTPDSETASAVASTTNTFPPQKPWLKKQSRNRMSSRKRAREADQTCLRGAASSTPTCNLPRERFSTRKCASPRRAERRARWGEKRRRRARAHISKIPGGACASERRKWGSWESGTEGAGRREKKN